MCQHKPNGYPLSTSPTLPLITFRRSQSLMQAILSNVIFHDFGGSYVYNDFFNFKIRLSRLPHKTDDKVYIKSVKKQKNNLVVIIFSVITPGIFS